MKEASRYLRRFGERNIPLALAQALAGTAKGWRPRYGIERLREALDDVAECRGLITRRLRP